jgi:hypothetical protein
MFFLAVDKVLGARTICNTDVMELSFRKKKKNNPTREDEVQC